MRICFQSFLITNQFETQLINSPPPPSWASFVVVQNHQSFHIPSNSSKLS
ncbi:unnamed protein product [Brassica oleracea var. botrytis]|uniref:Uncharacterized protein n=1 Tax=Brassica oleracea var. oleracea TaxID=109376 RepID=A0A0D3BEW8_BRAOL